MKKIIILAIALMCSMSVNAQIIDAKTKTITATKSAKTSKEPVDTGFTYKSTDGQTYKVYMGSTGACYIKKISKKTGKEYKQYLGEEISKEVCKVLKVDYTPRNKTVSE